MGSVPNVEAAKDALQHLQYELHTVGEAELIAIDILAAYINKEDVSEETLQKLKEVCE